MKPIRVLITDDSVIVRKLLSDILSTDPEIEVIGTAPNGRIALARIAQLKPDLVTLDIEMPEMDGLETLAELRRDYPKLPVIMFSTLTERGAASTLDALALGANDYVTKPSNDAGGAKAALEKVRAELIPKIKAFCTKQPQTRTAASAPRTAAPIVAVPRKAKKIEIIAVGVSTGGPRALDELFAELPQDLPVPIVMVQHMPPLFTKMLAERLASKSGLPVFEAKDGDVIKPGATWIAPGDYHMTLHKEFLQTKVVIGKGPRENSCRPSVDALFRSVGKIYGEAALAVILTGMGKDGLSGCREIHEKGGRVVVQDEATSVVWGMPGVVAEDGLADEILPLGEIARNLAGRARFQRDRSISTPSPAYGR